MEVSGLDKFKIESWSCENCDHVHKQSLPPSFCLWCGERFADMKTVTVELLSHLSKPICFILPTIKLER